MLPDHVCVLAPGDDPNYWMALTQQADADYVSKKVRKMLAEINQPGSHPVSDHAEGCGCQDTAAMAMQPLEMLLDFCPYPAAGSCSSWQGEAYKPSSV